MDYPEVIFDNDSHTYSQGGIIVPRSVTSLLDKFGVTKDISGIPSAILEKARQRGEAYTVGRKYIIDGVDLDPDTIDPQIACYLTAFSKWVIDRKPVFIESEVPRVSPMGFGFKADIFCEIDGVMEVVDDKCTYELPKSIGPQTAGYQVGWNSLFPKLPVVRRRALWLKKDGTYYDPILNDIEDIECFLDCLKSDIKNQKWRNKYGK